MRPSTDFEVREATPSDRPRILELLQASLGWVPDSQYERFFEWKHLENPFGPSPAWVAVDGDRIVGFRTFLRWDWVDGDGRVHPSVRAVDTATHPDYQGRGLFKLLTLHALEQFEKKGISFVFNTPNDQSRPGYMKMGWELVARLPVLMRQRSLLSVPRIVRARVPADKWSEPTGAGVPAVEVLAHQSSIAALLETQPRWHGLATRHSPDYLLWRYGFQPLHYRALLDPTGRVEDGLVLFRLRLRGSAREAVIADILAPNPKRGDALVRLALRESRADYAVRLRVDRFSNHGFLPVPMQGPTFVWRRVLERAKPEASVWKLSMGDVELF